MSTNKPSLSIPLATGQLLVVSDLFQSTASATVDGAAVAYGAILPSAPGSSGSGSSSSSSSGSGSSSGAGSGSSSSSSGGSSSSSGSSSTSSSGSTSGSGSSTVTTSTSTGYPAAFTGFVKTGESTAPASGSGVLLNDGNPKATALAGTTYTVPAVAAPTAGQTITDPVFGTTIRALPMGMRHVYSQLQPFTTDDSLMLTLVPDGIPGVAVGYGVIKYPSCTTVTMAAEFANAVAPRWVPGTHKLVSTEYAKPEYPQVTIVLWDADAGTKSKLYTLPFVQVDANTFEEDMSYDGQWTGLHAQDASGTWWVCALNLATGQIGAKINATSFASLDWCAVSPLGTYLMVNSNGTSNGGSTTGFGLELYNVQTGAFVSRLYDADTHLDHGLDANGHEIVVTTILSSVANNNIPGMATYNLTTGSMTQIDPITWAAAPDHYSMQGPPGQLVMDAAWAGESTGLQVLEGEIAVMYGDGSIRRLAHHRSNPAIVTNADLQYWTQAQAAMSRSGKLCAFASNWNTAGANPQGYVLEGLSL